MVEGEVLERLAHGLREGAARELLELVEEVVAGGKDVRQLVRDLMDYLREQLVAAVEGGGDGGWKPANLIRTMRELAQAEADMRWSPHPRLVLEMALLRLTPVSSMEVAAPPPPAETASPPVPGSAGDDRPAGDGPPVVQPQKTSDAGVDWPRILAAVRAANVPLHSFLRMAQPIQAGEGRLTLAFPAHAEVQMKRAAAQSPGILEQTLAEITGQQWEICFELDSKTPPRRPRKRSETSEPLVRQALTLFEGEVVEDDGGGGAT